MHSTTLLPIINGINMDYTNNVAESPASVQHTQLEISGLLTTESSMPPAAAIKSVNRPQSPRQFFERLYGHLEDNNNLLSGGRSQLGNNRAKNNKSIIVSSGEVNNRHESNSNDASGEMLMSSADMSPARNSDSSSSPDLPTESR